MPSKYLFLLLALITSALLAVIIFWHQGLSAPAGVDPPATVTRQTASTELSAEPPCPDEHPEWRPAQEIEGVSIVASPQCQPDNPYEVAAAVKGTNNISMATLMRTDLAQDALVIGNDKDHDGDPDIVYLKLEVVELNGFSPDGDFLMNTYDIAPGLQPAMWTFAPKSRGMGVKNFNSKVANPILRAPSPTIRVEQGDEIRITLENTHYLPHTIHLHGVDHPFMTADGHDNDGVEEHAVYPGSSHTYEFKPRHAGTMLYHCHVQTAQHLMMGMAGMLVVEENQPNNWLQTINIGAGQVRHPSVAVSKNYAQEYDLFYQSLDKRLSQIVQQANDPRLVAERMTRVYNITESFENYYLLNGRAFPYTLRDSLVVVNDNENIKLRVANMQRSALALHIHGHKATITGMDGVDLNPGQQITRDVFDLAPAQRLDLSLKTQNDGLHSYGPGLWMFHDHVPTGATTDGMEPGGNMAILAYRPLLDELGMPKMHDELFAQVFNKDYYAKKTPVWQRGDFAQLLGDAGMITPNYLQLIIFGLASGGLIGILVWVLMHTPSTRLDKE